MFTRTTSSRLLFISLTTTNINFVLKLLVQVLRDEMQSGFREMRSSMQAMNTMMQKMMEHQTGVVTPMTDALTVDQL